MLLRRGVLAALTALLVAAPSAVALSGHSDTSVPGCVANCSDSSASNEAPTTETGSPSDSGSDDAGNQKGDDGASTPDEPGGQTDGGTGNTGGDNSGDSTIDLCKFEPWNNPRCGVRPRPVPGCDGCETTDPIECNFDGKREGPNVCHPLNPCAAESPEQDPKCITDPTVDPPALPSCEVDSTDGETYCSLPWTPCKFKPSTGEKICPPVDPPVDCTTTRFASEEAAAAAGCGPAVDPPAPSGIRVCKTDNETGERSCRSLERGDYGCFETEDGPWICVDPAPEPPVLCNINEANSERCVGPFDGGGCFKTEGGETACYDRVVLNPKPPLVNPNPSVIQPKGKPTAGKPQKQAKGPKSRSQSAKGKKKHAKAKPKANGKAKAKGKGKGKLKAKRAPARSAR